MKLFVTGVTGAIGHELLLRAAGDPRVAQARFLVRARSRAAMRERWRALVERAGPEVARQSAAGRLVPAWGDLVADRLGVEDHDRRFVEGEVTHVLHAAAAIDFNAPSNVVDPVNVGGTAALLDLCGGARRLEAMAYVSTLYVAGRRTGLILEEELLHDAGFENAYEESKYQAELRVRPAFARLPAAVYRLPLCIGRRRDGYVHRFLEAHKLLELFHRGRCHALPGSPAATLDILPTDDACDQLWALATRAFRPGSTFHLSAADTAPTLSRIGALMAAQLGLPALPIRHLDERAWEEARTTDDPAAFGLTPGAVWMFEVLGGYLLHEKRFDRRHADAALASAGLPSRLPTVEEYLPRVLSYCAAQRWGRGALPAS